ncbi:hypothetical protein HDU67_000422 [Dinochytrium kinnereticum]|nr:hypothetical protein HDU67_000422 [Dinochytrium kinnereticum]
MTVKDARIKRCQEFFNRNKRDHDHVVATNRGFNFEGLPDCYNLGNCLNITQKLVEDLNKDPDQSVQLLRGVPIPLKDPSCSIILHGIYDGESAIEPNNPGRDDLIEADNLVKEQFAEKNVVADLSGVVEDEFSLEYAKDARTGKILGAAEFVQMKRYLWLHHLAVDREARGCGVGATLLDRLKYIAACRGKQLLCFALYDVVDWYAQQGFTSAEKDFPRKSWHIGRFMVYTPPGVSVPVSKVENLYWVSVGG